MIDVESAPIFCAGIPGRFWEIPVPGNENYPGNWQPYYIIALENQQAKWNIEGQNKKNRTLVAQRQKRTSSKYGSRVSCNLGYTRVTASHLSFDK